MLTRAFGAQERPFVLKGAQWRDLEKARDCGLGLIAARLAPLVTLQASGVKAVPGGLMAAVAGGHLGSARLDDVREPILQGLIGGGLTSTEAGALVRAVFDETVDRGGGPLMIWASLAFEIVTGALLGLEDETPTGEPPVGESGAAARPARRRSPTARRTSATSTPPSA